MQNLEPNNPEASKPTKPKQSKSKTIIILTIVLIISIIGNLFLGASWGKYIEAYNVLQNNFLTKDNTLSLTERQLKQSKEEKRILEDTLKKTTDALAQYDNEYRKLVEQDATSRIPKGYYISSGSGGNKSYDDLKDFLNYKFYLPKNYTLGIFDCSESAAYLEYVLQNNGFEAKIAVGKDPAGSDIGHAWVFVTTGQGVAAVEPTVLTGGVQRLIESLSNIMNNSARGVIYYNKNDQTSTNYYESFDAVFEDIKEAVKYSDSIDEWNWWEGSWGFE